VGEMARQRSEGALDGRRSLGVLGAFTAVAGLAGALLPADAIADTFVPPTITNPDNRVRVNPTTADPAKSTGQIVWQNGVYCSAWAYDSDTAGTAGHCVYDDGAWLDAAGYGVYYPGLNDGAKPYGACSTGQLFSVTGWTGSHNWNYDYGAFEFEGGCQPAPYSWKFDNEVEFSDVLRSYGYPEDKGGDQMWRTDGQVTQFEITEQWAYTTLDETDGQSGSPVRNLNSSLSGYRVAGTTSGDHCFVSCTSRETLILSVTRVGNYEDWAVVP
jgi:glutamyl endopeptidase